MDSTFRKVDLHIHTPKSVCYGDPSATAEQIVENAVATNLEVIGIADHNTAQAITYIREAARKKRLFVFPGIEISTKGGHILAIFDLDTPTKELEEYLDYIGIDRDGWGNAAIQTQDGTEEVLKKIDERGGIGIAAHIERWPSGFLETNQPLRVKRRIHGSSYLSALEITVPENSNKWNNGEMRNYPKKYACIQSSDAHTLNEIGRRPVYIQMEQVSLAALRQAFAEYEKRIVFPDQFISGK